jgi:hypothetical protein
LGGVTLKSFYEALKKHINAHPPNYGDCDARSILEMLWNCYCQHNQMDTDQIKDGFANLYRHMKHLPLSDVDGVIDIVCSLCWEHEKAGFVEGVKVGIRLGQELTN